MKHYSRDARKALATLRQNDRERERPICSHLSDEYIMAAYDKGRADGARAAAECEGPWITLP